MSRPKFFRDPIHLQLRFSPAEVREPLPPDDSDKRQSWLLRQLIDSKPFQRLRFIRQTGLANLVFHGAEHSRFNHSMGVMYLGRTMYRCISRNTGDEINPGHELSLTAAALLHDIGHGPFSHTLEEILGDLQIDFHHEKMTLRFILEEDSPINGLLASVDPKFPHEVGAYIDHELRPEDNWRYKIVSSQLDADRLDYCLRDAYYCGLKGHSFDIFRILDLLQHREGKQIGVDEGALEAIEGYLVTLDQLWRAIYYHHSVRAAACLLTSTLRRAALLHHSGDKSIFGDNHPFGILIDNGQRTPLEIYSRLGDHQVWTLIDGWRSHKDQILSDLSERLLGRQLFKTIETPLRNPKEIQRYISLREQARELTLKLMPDLTKKDVDYYVCEDAPERTSYKRYTWTPESSSESIWILGGPDRTKPIEDETQSPILKALREHTHYFPRLMVLPEIREAILQQSKGQ